MKKKLLIVISIIIFIFLIIYFSFNQIYLKYKNKKFIEKTDVVLAENLKNSPFKINKIILYSSGYGENKNKNFQKSNWILDIYQYTDIALYVDCSEAIKNLSISNFVSEHGNFYYLDSTKFGTGEISKDYEINPKLDFIVLNDSNIENTINYNTPIFFADASNPITLKFVNTIEKNFIIENNEKLKFDGSLLEKTHIKLDDLKAKISFDVNITNYNNEEYSTKINLNIPIENKNSTIFTRKYYGKKGKSKYSFIKKIEFIN